jgi:hypothetical protein
MIKLKWLTNTLYTDKIEVSKQRGVVSMPNWCTNSLSVTAENKEDLTQFLEKVRGEDESGNLQEFTFHSLVPRPKSESDNWYDWNIGNWGTKWDANDAYVSIEEEYAYFSFDTAWSPPIEWVRAVAPMFPELTFELTYHEGGMGFAGKLCMQGEEVFDDFTVGSDSEEYWDIMTEGMSQEEIEERAMERIESDALDYWEYTIDELFKYIGEEHRKGIEDLILINKLSGDMERSSVNSYNGSDLEPIIAKIMDVSDFYKKIFEVKKKEKLLKRFAG